MIERSNVAVIDAAVGGATSWREAQTSVNEEPATGAAGVAPETSAPTSNLDRDDDETANIELKEKHDEVLVIKHFVLCQDALAKFTTNLALFLPFPELVQIATFVKQKILIENRSHHPSLY